MTNKRMGLLNEIWDAEDESYDLMQEYDSLPHRYGNRVLFQAEAYIVNCIGHYPDITTTELAKELRKTPSACSQIIRKLVEQELVVQNRNQTNKRIYNLRLTESGQKLYQDHISFNEDCQKITFDMLEQFSEAELETFLRVQKCINEAYRGDIRRSRERNADE